MIHFAIVPLFITVCYKLQELPYQNTGIYLSLRSFEEIFLVPAGLQKQCQLRWLNLSNNNLSLLDVGILEKLAALQYLSVENNSISSLCGLEVRASL